MSILLDYVFKVSSVTPTPPASTGFLKKACLVVKPKTGETAGDFEECTTPTQVAALTDNVDATQFFAAGMSRVFILTVDDLADVATSVPAGRFDDFFTLLISSDFSKEEVDGDEIAVPGVKAQVIRDGITYRAKVAGVAGNGFTVKFVDSGLVTGDSATASLLADEVTIDIDSGVTTADSIITAFALVADVDAILSGSGSTVQTSAGGSDIISLTGGVDATTEVLGPLNVGTFKGVIGLWTDDATRAATWAAKERWCAFFSSITNKAKNMVFAFGSLLSNQANWRNQQFIAMPVGDGVATEGASESFFDDRVSFVLTDNTQFSHRLSFFVVGGKAIVEPYIRKNLELDLQSRALSWISANQPSYTHVNASLLQNALTEIMNIYINDRNWIESGSVSVRLLDQNFVGTGTVEFPEPGALWRILTQLTETN